MGTPERCESSCGIAQDCGDTHRPGRVRPQRAVPSLTVSADERPPVHRQTALHAPTRPGGRFAQRGGRVTLPRLKAYAALVWVLCAGCALTPSEATFIAAYLLAASVTTLWMYRIWELRYLPGAPECLTPFAHDAVTVREPYESKRGSQQVETKR
jgi:hypothetical protein